MAQLTELNKISIIYIVLYVPILFVAILLFRRHGFHRSSGWLYVNIFAIARILGGALNLATISSPSNISLWIGSQTLQSIGLSPLLLVLLGLLSRVFFSIPQKSRPLIPNTNTLRIVHVIIFVGLILLIIGGVDNGNQIGNDIEKGEPLHYKMSSLSKAGTGLLAGAYALLVMLELALLFHMPSIAKGEKRLLLAVGAALPFVLVRLVYALLAAFDTSNINFHGFGSGVHYAKYLLGMCVVPELVAVLLFEAVGLTLQYVSYNKHGVDGAYQGLSRVSIQSEPSNNSYQLRTTDNAVYTGKRGVEAVRP